MSLNTETLIRMLERMPGATFYARMDPKAGTSTWLYVSSKMKDLYDFDEETLRANPYAVLERIVPEDRPLVEAKIAESVGTGVFAIASRIQWRNGEIRWMETHATLEPDGEGYLLWYGQVIDVTDRKLLETELHTRNEQLAASEGAKGELIERLRFSIEELSNPILEVWDDVLVMPIIGVVDSRRTADMVQRLLSEVTRTQASFVIIDLTGVEIVDTKTADHLMKLMRKVEIVGARCVLTGIRPAVAETLVDIGVDFGRLATLRNLKHGLREALRAGRREKDLGRDLAGDDEPAAEPAPKRRSRKD